jgi:uncharacterized protein
MRKGSGNQQARTWATWCHLSSQIWILTPLTVGFSVPLALQPLIPLLGIVVPLIIWLKKREFSSFVDEHGKESLNFQFSISLFVVIAAIYWMLSPAYEAYRNSLTQPLSAPGLQIFTPFFWLMLLAVYQLCFVVLAMQNVQKGQPFRYPLTIRFLK